MPYTFLLISLLPHYFNAFPFIFMAVRCLLGSNFTCLRFRFVSVVLLLLLLFFFGIVDISRVLGNCRNVDY